MLEFVDGQEGVRIDKWLWAARVFKTRALAIEACRAGHVKLDGATLKPGRAVREGDVVEVQTAGPLRTLKITRAVDKRVGGKLVPTILEELTPPEELERSRRTVVEQVLARPRGAGRPTKRDRRLIEKLLP